MWLRMPSGDVVEDATAVLLIKTASGELAEASAALEFMKEEWNERSFLGLRGLEWALPFFNIIIVNNTGPLESLLYDKKLVTKSDHGGWLQGLHLSITEGNARAPSLRRCYIRNDQDVQESPWIEAHSTSLFMKNFYIQLSFFLKMSWIIYFGFSKRSEACYSPRKDGSHEICNRDSLPKFCSSKILAAIGFDPTNYGLYGAGTMQALLLVILIRRVLPHIKPGLRFTLLFFFFFCCEEKQRCLQHMTQRSIS